MKRIKINKNKLEEGLLLRLKEYFHNHSFKDQPRPGILLLEMQLSDLYCHHFQVHR